MDHYNVSFKDLEPIVIWAHNKEEALKKAVNQVIKSNNGTLSEKEVLLIVKKVNKVEETDPFMVTCIIAFILASIIVTYAVYRNWGRSDVLEHPFLFTAVFFIFFAITFYFFFLAPLILFSLMVALKKVVKNEYRKYCLRRKYSKYFKRFNVMLPGETITFKDMENDPVFNDAIEAYFKYKRKPDHYSTKDGFHRSHYEKRWQ